MGTAASSITLASCETLMSMARSREEYKIPGATLPGRKETETNTEFQSNTLGDCFGFFLKGQGE